jgi:hypothetical protein
MSSGEIPLFYCKSFGYKQLDYKNIKFMNLYEAKWFGFWKGAVLGFEFRASSTASAMPPALFALVILEVGSCFLSRPAWTVRLLF